MNNGPLVTSILAEVERSGLKSSLRDRIVADRSSLMQSLDVPTTLLGALVAHSGDEWPPAAQVLELLIDDARMDAENEGAFGAGFLSSLESAISKLIDQGQLTSVAVASLARCYGRANVQVPERLVSFHLAQIEEGVDRSRTLPPDFDEALASLAREADGNFYVLHEGLRETTAGLPPEMSAALEPFRKDVESDESVVILCVAPDSEEEGAGCGLPSIAAPPTGAACAIPAT